MSIASKHLLISKYPIILDIGDYGVKRLIAIGDIHGCLDELVELMDQLKPAPEDIVVFVGDLVDRGPRSPAVVAYVRYLCENRPSTFCLMGNHDEKLARHRRHTLKAAEEPGYRNPMKVPDQRLAEWTEIPDDDCLWVARLPHVVRLTSLRKLDTRLLTHAGLIEGLVFRQPTDGLIRNRYLIPNTKICGSCGGIRSSAFGAPMCDACFETGIHKGLKWSAQPMGAGHSQPPGSSIWDEVWTGFRVIYGHIVSDLNNPRIYNNCYGIDTGCCFGGKLTAYVEDFRTNEVRFVQVQAKVTYEAH